MHTILLLICEKMKTIKCWEIRSSDFDKVVSYLSVLIKELYNSGKLLRQNNKMNLKQVNMKKRKSIDCLDLRFILLRFHFL